MTHQLMKLFISQRYCGHDDSIINSPRRERKGCKRRARDDAPTPAYASRSIACQFTRRLVPFPTDVDRDLPQLRVLSAKLQVENYSQLSRVRVRSVCRSRASSAKDVDSGRTWDPREVAPRAGDGRPPSELLDPQRVRRT